MKLIKKYKNKTEIKNWDSLDKDFYFETPGGKVSVFLTKEHKKLLDIKEHFYSSIKKEDINYYRLRDYQRKPLEYIFKHNKVILNLPIRYGKTYISISAALNCNGNKMFFLDKNMLLKFKEIIKNDFDYGDEVFIMHDKENKDFFKGDHDNFILLTTEETFLSWQKDFNDQENKKLKTINFLAIDEYHNFIKKSDKRFKSLELLFKKGILNPDILIFLSASPTNEKISNSFRVMKLIDKDFMPTNWESKYYDIPRRGRFRMEERKVKKSTKGKFKIMLQQVFYFDEKMINPFHSLIFQRIYVEQDEELIEIQKNEPNNSYKQMISDDYRIFRKTKNMLKGIPKKTIKAIEIIEKNKNKKIVVITHFRDAQSKLKKDFINANIKSEIINGSTSIKKRAEHVEAFQKGDLNVIIIQKDTAIGITLDNADLSIIISSTYQPQVFYQAAGRLVCSDINNLNLKDVYWVLDNFDEEAKDSLHDKQLELFSFGFDYLPSDEKNQKIICESNTDSIFLKRILYPELEIKFFNINNYSLNSKSIKLFCEMLNDYLFVVDNDDIISNLKLKENGINYITFNKLLGVSVDLKTIEDILEHEGIYSIKTISDINLFKNHNKDGSILKSIYEQYSGKEMEKEELKDEIIKYRNKLNLSCPDKIDLIESFICEEMAKLEDKFILSRKIINKFSFISNYIKSWYMDDIDNDYFSDKNRRRTAKKEVLYKKIT